MSEYIFIFLLCFFSYLSGMLITKSTTPSPTLSSFNDKAIYLPGSVCILKTTETDSPKDILYFADACVNSHREWLEDQENKGTDEKAK